MSFGFLVAAAHRGLRNYEINVLRTGPFVPLFACLLATLTHLLALHCLLCTACLACTLRCAHSFARLLTHSLRSSWERGFCLLNERVDLIQFQPPAALPVAPAAVRGSGSGSGGGNGSSGRGEAESNGFLRQEKLVSMKIENDGWTYSQIYRRTYHG